MAMSAAGRGKRGAKNADQVEAAGRKQLDDLDARLDRARGNQPKAETESASERSAAIGMAMRLGLELVVGTVVGGFIGWQLDQWLGTTPFLLLIFFFLGIAAGILNVIRTAYEIQSTSD